MLAIAGYLDVCVGNFWDSQERRAYASMGPSLYQSPFHMFTAFEDHATFWDAMQTPLTPFTGSTWWLVLGVTLFVGCFSALLDTNLCADNHRDDGEQPTDDEKQTPLRTLLTNVRDCPRARPAFY